MKIVTLVGVEHRGRCAIRVMKSRSPHGHPHPWLYDVTVVRADHERLLDLENRDDLELVLQRARDLADRDAIEHAPVAGAA